ncbi:MAG: B12-binding domain-containing radical SAM protein, partial [Candidatus Omnitrophica bacterium]|nr:B12-binding domain-containing radical SAM protein [Candidatus Omnitrophota bacterium]
MNRKVKKVLLFIPPAITFKDYLDVNPLPPLGLGYLGAVLEDAGIEVKIVDCLMEGWHNRIEVAENIIRVGLSFDQIEDIIRGYGPDIVGVNNMFTKQRGNAHKIYDLAKRVDRNIITIGGGAHPTVMPELVLSDQNVDFIVLGEGEDTITGLVNFIEGKGDISVLDGVGYKENGQIRIIPKTKFIADLDRLPFPARHLLNMERYFGLKASHGTRRRDRFSPIVTSRGCPAKCIFCSAHKAWGRKFRPRSPENAIAEM